MICMECRNRKHGRCKGGSWCDCHHRDLVGRALEMNDTVAQSGKGLVISIDPDLIKDEERRWA